MSDPNGQTPTSASSDSTPLISSETKPPAVPDAPDKNEWFEAPTQKRAFADAPGDDKVLEVPVVEEPAPQAPAQVVDESKPMAMPAAQAGEPAEQAESSSSSHLVVRYGVMRQLGEFNHDLPYPPVPGSKVVIRTERGVEIGEVVVTVSSEPSWRCVTSGNLRDYIRDCGPEYPYTRGGKVLRHATPQDIIDQRHLEASAREEGTYARQQIREIGLPMRLVTVEHVLGGERVIFYFSAETRVDFRELVRRLAAQFRTRIEMRQVGARDEARLVGDYERCGQRCCCQEYIKDLKPVSMRMAKTQKATLDPTKISGRCGRLMCCLRYEDTVYEDLRKRLPKKNIWVKTAKLVGKVIDVQIITQLVRVLLPDYTQAVIANEDIIERDVPPPEVKTVTVAAPRHEEKRERRMLRDESGNKAALKPMPSASQPTLPVPSSVDGAINENELVQQPGGNGDDAAAPEGDVLETVGTPTGQDAQRSGRRRRKRRRGRGGQGGPDGQIAQGQQGQPQQQRPVAAASQAQPSGDSASAAGELQGEGGVGQGQAQGGQAQPAGQQSGRNRRRRRGRRRGRGDGAGRPPGSDAGPGPTTAPPAN